MQIHKASEDYLEAMLMLKESKGYIRSVDIAEKLGVTKPSVSYATKRLRGSGHITMAKNGLIELTDKGMSIAKDIYRKHTLLTEFFIGLGVDPVVAREDACKIEHEISDESFRALSELNDKLKAI